MLRRIAAVATRMPRPVTYCAYPSFIAITLHSASGTNNFVCLFSLFQFGGQSTDEESRRHESGPRGGLLWHELGGPEPELWPRRRWKGAEHQHGGHVH